MAAVARTRAQAAAGLSVTEARKINKANGTYNTGGSSSSSSSSSAPAAAPAATPTVSPNVDALNKARADAVANGQSPYAGNLKDLATFSATQPAVPPVVATTAPDRTTFLNNSSKLDTIMNGKMGTTTPTTTTTVPNGTVDPNAGATGADGKPSPKPDTATAKATDGLTDSTTLATNELDAETKRRNEAYAALKRNNDATYNATVDQLATTYGDLATKAKDASARYMGTLNQAAYSDNAFRYTPQITAGTIYNAEQEGIDKLKALDNEENNLIIQARLARDNNNFTALNDHMDALDKIGQARVKVLSDQYDTAKKLQDTIDAQTKQSKRDDAITGIVAKGVTDPATILNSLNYDDKGNRIGDYTLKEVSDALGNLKQPDLGGGNFAFDSKQTASLLGAGLSMTDIQAIKKDLSSGASIDEVFGDGSGFTPDMKAAVQHALGVDPTVDVKPGIGATSNVDEQIIRSRLFGKLSNVLNKGSLSDADAARINTTIASLRDAGLSEQDIMDKMSGFSTTVQSPYNSSFRDLIIQNTDTTDKQAQLSTKISSLIDSGNYTGAMTTVENTSMENAKKLDPDNYMGQSTAESYLKKVDAIRGALADAGVVGYIPGGFQNILGKLKSSDATKLKAAVNDLVVDMRHDLSGTAVTESEAKFLDPLIPDISDPKTNFIDKLNALQNRTLNRYNATRSSVSLPQITNVKQVWDPKSRLQLYSNDTSSGIISPTSTGGSTTQHVDI